MEYSYYTKKNTKYKDKPNEDYIVISEKLFIVLDGVSRSLENGSYPNPSPSKHVAELVGEYIKEYIQNNNSKNKEELIYNAILNANQKVHEYNVILNHKHKAGCVGVILLFDNDNIYYAYIGDCIGLALNEKKYIFTEKQTKQISQHGQEFTTEEIRNNICNNINHPYSYGVLDGNQCAMNFVKTGKLNNNIKAIIISSDGMAKYLFKENIDKLLTLSAKEMIDDPSEYNHSDDDKSIIKITI